MSVIFSFFYSSPFSFLLLLSPFLFFSNEKKKEISFSFSNAFSFVREEKKEEFFSIFISFLKRRRGGNGMERGRREWKE